MVDVPERIWIEHDEDCPYFYEEDELHEVGAAITEYIHTNLYAALEAQLAETQEKLIEANDKLIRQNEALSRTGAVKGEPTAFLVERLAGSGYGSPRTVIDAAKYDPRCDEFWIGDAKSQHLVTPLYALEPAAPEDHKAASAASVDPDGIWERAYAETAGVQPDDETNQGKEGFCYRDENGKVQFQQTAPAANETRRGKSRGEPHKHGPNDEPGSLAAEQSGETGPGASGGQEPVAWRCKDYADGWVVYGEKSAADRHQRNDGCLMQPLYTRPAEQAVTEAMVEAAARAMCAPFPPDETIYLGGYYKRWETHMESAALALKAAMEAGRHD